MGQSVRFEVLGSLQVTRDGQPVDLGTFRQRALLALLLTRPGTVFSTDQIIDGLWGEDGNRDRQNALWVYVSGLRTALEPGRAKRSEGLILLTRAPGYVIEAAADDVDSMRFERLVHEGRSLTDTDPAAASSVLAEALALWRGRAFEEFTYEAFAQAEIERLGALRTEALEARIDADLRRGLSSELVSELESLVREHPLHEAFTGHLMVALYRAGRQVESLRAYQTLRTRLGTELGLEPSAMLRRIEQQIVTGDDSLSQETADRRPAGPVPGLVVRGYELREQIGVGASGVVHRAYQPSVGREVAIKVIRPEFADDPDFIRRFEAEAQLVARLEHPHIVPLYDFWREPGAAYLAMRLLRAGNLDVHLADGPLDPELVVQLAQQVGGALDTAHRAGVVHRDVRPANVLLDDDGNAYLSDFGIAVGADTRGTPALTGETLRVPYASPEQLGEGRVTPASDIYSLAIVLGQALTGLHAGPEQLRDALRPAVRGVFDRAVRTDAADRPASVPEFVDELTVALGGSPTRRARVADAPNPYKGLRAFSAADAADFFGRSRSVERLVARVGSSGPAGRFVAVVGPSGSGKSSLVKAGLLQAVERAALARSERWFSVSMTPAPHPFESLDDVLRSVAVNPPASMLAELVSSAGGLRAVVDRVLPDDGSQLLLVIDQFEELFTQVEESTANAFMAALHDAVTSGHSRVRVVVTLRADFYDRPLEHRSIGELMRSSTELITPMSADELEQAITGPAARVGVTFEPTLVARLVHDVADRGGALPLLQHTLTELFDARTGTVIPVGAYDDIGGVSGAIAQRAEGVFASLAPDGRRVAEQIFLRLITLGEGTDDTRRRVLRLELEQLAVGQKALTDVLDSFGRHRLLSFDRDPVTRGPTVEISHEALLHEWGRLSRWVESARDDLRNQRRLAAGLREWQAADEHADYLLTGGVLDQLSEWASISHFSLSGPEQDFLERSIAGRDQRVAEARAKEDRVVAAEGQARRRLRQLVGAGALAAVVAALAIFGIVQWRSASSARDDAARERDQAAAARDDAAEERDQATAARDEAADERDEAAAARLESARLVAAEQFRTASAAVLDEDPELALLLAVEAVRATSELGYATEEAVDSVHWALHQLGVSYPADDSTPVTRRSGPTGLTGVFVLPPAELVALAEGATDRRLTSEECAVASELGCSPGGPLDPDLPFRFGAENYAVVVPEVVPGVPAYGDGPLAGTQVTLALTSVVAFNEALERELGNFTDQTGIRVELLSNFDLDLTAALGVGNVDSYPDVVGLFTPPQGWTSDRAIDLSTYLDTSQLRADFGDYLLDLGTTEGQGASELHGIPMNVLPKGMVFYPRAAFEAAGYEVPASWDELVALSDQIVADGGNPWCFQWESGFATGWAGTDLLESFVIRSAGVDVYDDWVAGTVGFDSPAIVESGRLAEQLLFTADYVRGGSASITSASWPLVLQPMRPPDPVLGTGEPECWLAHQTSTFVSLLGPFSATGEENLLGEHLDFFPLPPIDVGDTPTMTGGATFATALGDRPEVRAFMEFVASPAWGEVWAGVDGPGGGDVFISANQRFDTAAYSGIPGPATQRVQPRTAAATASFVRLHETQQAALQADTWRFDASDHMPPEFGAWTAELVPGPFFKGMIDWVDQTETIEDVLADIEAARPTA